LALRAVSAAPRAVSAALRAVSAALKAEMMGTMNMALHNLRDPGQEALEADDCPNGGPCHKESSSQWNWPNVEYSRHVAARQDAFDRILQGADHLIASAIPPGATKSERDGEAAWAQTQARMQGVVDIATELGEASFSTIQGTEQK
jgi:hypothetical protein